jgi:hypothetical protein
MRYTIVTCALAGIILLISSVGCSRNNEQPVQSKTITDDAATREKHCPRTVRDKSWIAVVWVSGTALSNGRVPPLTIRLTPINKDNMNVPRAEASFRMFSRPAGNLLAKTQTDLEFQDCANMKARHDIVVTDGTFGDEEEFPPKTRCFECSIHDPFNLDGNLANGKFFKRGSYDLVVELVIQDGSKLLFQSIPMRNLGGP